MTQLKFPRFRGMVPRRDEQHLGESQAVQATNTDLDSGELRPMVAPQLAKTFPRAGEPGFLSPRPVDPSDPNPEVPPPTDCVPVQIVVPLESVIEGQTVESVTFSVGLNADASHPVIVRWYVDDILQAGETGTTITIPISQLQEEYNNGELVSSPNVPVLTRVYGIVKAVAENPCGRVESTALASVEIDAAEEYYEQFPECRPHSCDAFSIMAEAHGLYHWPCNNSPSDGYLAGTVNVPVIGSYYLRNSLWFGSSCGDWPHWEVDDQLGAEELTAHSVGVYVPLNSTVAMLYKSTGGASSAFAFAMRQYWESEPSPRDGRTTQMQVSLFIRPFQNGDLRINNDGADITVPSAIPADGLPHVISVTMSGCPASTTTSKYPGAKDTFACHYDIFVDGILLARTTRDVEIPYMPSTNDPRMPIHFVLDHPSARCSLPGGSSDMRFSNVVIGGDVLASNIRRAYLQSFSGYEPPEYCIY